MDIANYSVVCEEEASALEPLSVPHPGLLFYFSDLVYLTFPRTPQSTLYVSGLILSPAQMQRLLSSWCWRACGNCCALLLVQVGPEQSVCLNSSQDSAKRTQAVH